MFRGQDKIYCVNHPSVEAEVFCDTCSTMRGCSGYFCGECDKMVHKIFVTHQIANPNVCPDKKPCDKHPGHNTEEAFCWESKTFHCAECAHDANVESEVIPTAVDKALESLKVGYSQLEDNLKRLSDHRDKISSELNGDNNTNLEVQMEAVRTSIQSSFNHLRMMLEKREKVLLEEAENYFNTKITQFNEETTEITDAIEEGNVILGSFDSFLTAKKDAELLKKLVDARDKVGKVINVVEKSESHPVIHTETKVDFNGIEGFVEKILNMGKFVKITNMPAPLDFRYTEITLNSIKLTWDPLKTALPITYRVLYKETFDSDEKWTECYNGQKTECKCSHLRESTGYVFRVYAIYEESKSIYYNTCSARTVKALIIINNLIIIFHEIRS